jgi:hypothetical protein
VAKPVPFVVSPGFLLESRLRVARAMVQAQERATSSISRKMVLLAAAATVGLGLALVRLALGRHTIDPGQTWFWTPEWLAGELQADDEIAAERGIRHDSDEAFVAALEARLNPK